MNSDTSFSVDLAAPKLLTYAQVAQEFGIKIGTLYALVHDARIPHVRFGRRFVRFVRADVERWIANHSRGGDREATDE